MPVIPLRLATQLRRVLRAYRGARGWVSMVRRRRRDRDAGKPVVIVLTLNMVGPSQEVARLAQEMGFWVHIFAPSFPFLEAISAHDWSPIDARTDFGKGLQRAQKLQPVAILLEGKNLLLPMQNHLAKALGLRAIGDKAAQTSNSKIALREALDESNLPNVPWCIVEDYREGALPFPAVVKPDLGTASKGVLLVSSHDEFMRNREMAADAKADPSVGGRLLVEGFVAGRQFDLEGIARDGEYHLLCVVEEYYEGAPPHFPPAWFHFNAPIEAHMHEALWSATKKALAALGVTQGAWHVEQRIDETGTVRIVDFANRMGYNRMISAASGVVVPRAYIELMTAKQYEMPALAPEALLQLFALDPEGLDKIKRFVAEQTKHVFLHSFYPFEFSFHLYLGYLVVKFDNFEQQVEMLLKYDLVPPQFWDFYPNRMSQGDPARTQGFRTA